MYTAYSLARAVNESAGAVGTTTPVEAYPFTGLTLAESLHESATIALQESAVITGFSVGADEVLYEAAIANPDRLDVLSESILDSIKTGAKKFWEKMKSIVKGILDKLKAFFYQFTGKTDKWCKLMEKKIKEAASGTRAGNASFTAEMYKYNQDYILNGMVASAEKLLDHVKNDIIGAFTGLANESDQLLNKMANKSADDIENDSEFQEVLKEFDNNDRFSEEVTSNVADALGVSGATDLQDAYSKMVLNARGEEKTTMSYSELNVMGMLDAVKGSAKTITKIEDAYKKYLNELDKASKATDKLLHGASTGITKAGDKVDNKAPYAAAESYMKKAISVYTKQVSAYHSAIDTVRAHNVTLLQNMTKDYMGVLTKFVNYKAPKDSK